MLLKNDVRMMVNMLLLFWLYAGGDAAPFIAKAFPVDTILEEGVYTIDLSSYYNDTDAVIVEYTLFEQPRYSVQKNGPVFTITSGKDEFGVFRISTLVVDNAGDSCKGVFSLYVKNVNDPPRFIRTLADTSLNANEELILDVRSLYEDVDNQFDSLSLTWDTVAGVTLRHVDDRLYIRAKKSIDTSTIILRVRDPWKATTTAYFKFFANLPVSYNTPFRIQGDYTYQPSSLYYPEHIFNTAVDNCSENSIGIYGLLDGYLFYDRYGKTGQKMFPTLIHSSLKPQNLNEVEVHRLQNNSFFVFSTVGDSIDCILLDTVFVQIRKHRFSKLAFSGMIFREIHGTLLVGGRKVAYGSRYRMTIDVYDGALTKQRTDTLPDEISGGAIAELLVDDTGYMVVLEDKSVSSIISEFNAYRFTNEGVLAYKRTRLLPSINRNPELPINAHIRSKFIRFPDGRYAAVWSFQDVLQTGTNQYSMSSKPFIYGVIYDQNLEEATDPVEIYSYETEFIRTLMVYRIEVVGSTILMAWRDYAGNGDAIYYSHLFCGFDLQPVDVVYSDSIYITDYCWFNESMLFKMENRDDGVLRGMTIYPAFEGASAIRHPGNCRPSVSGQVVPSGASLNYFDLKGRAVSHPIKEYQESLRHTAAGFYLKKVPGVIMKKVAVE